MIFGESIFWTLTSSFLEMRIFYPFVERGGITFLLFKQNFFRSLFKHFFKTSFRVSWINWWGWNKNKRVFVTDPFQFSRRLKCHFSFFIHTECLRGKYWKSLFWLLFEWFLLENSATDSHCDYAVLKPNLSVRAGEKMSCLLRPVCL